MSEYWKGPALPWGVTIPSTIDPKDDFEVITSSILFICMTGFGERVMQPEFGSSLAGLLFEPNTDAVIAEVRAGMEEALSRWDDRVTFVDFSADRDGNSLHCVIKFKFSADKFHDDVQTYEFDIDEIVTG